MTSLTSPPVLGLPPVERLRPGLWSIPVPLPSSGLRHVFVYLFETDRGAYVVDSGWDTAEAFDAVEAGLATAGYAVTDLRGVMATHMHPDHYGLAGRLRAASGAWVSLHPADAALLRRDPIDSAELLAFMMTPLRRAGTPAAEIEAMTIGALPRGTLPTDAQPDVLLADGERPDVPGWDLRAVWTPGHSPGHLCFWEPSHRLLLSGDHVLPRITPNIPFEPSQFDDPLGDYLASLDKVAGLPAEEVLPAHEYRFADASARLAALRRHHESRFAEVVAALREGPLTGFEVGRRMTWSASWDEIVGFMKRAAVCEALAHLRALERRGVVREKAGDPPTWSLLTD
jgi:glyoxylase-like metal-dependent hydrolase (beta-lactamase superfamily II)